MRWWEEDDFGDSDLFDPLRVERSKALEDEEAELVEAICQEAAPGPLVIDDRTDGEGMVVATLPDGRHIISLCEADSCLEEIHRTIAANAQLFCEARHMILRLLRDRDHWRLREKYLLQKIQWLEAELERYAGTARVPERESARSDRLHPR